MKNLVFMLWVILWPTASTINDYIHFKMGKAYEKIKEDNEKTVLAMFGIWVIIAFFLYER